MELQTIVEALLGKLYEIAYMNGSVVAGQLHANSTLRCGQHGNFLTRGLICRSIQIGHSDLLLGAIYTYAFQFYQGTQVLTGNLSIFTQTALSPCRWVIVIDAL